MLIAVVRASAADTYTSLWQRFDKAAAAWQPRTAIAVLDKIIVRATAEKAYGHLVKAQIARGGLTIQISPDSLDAVAAQMAHRSSNGMSELKGIPLFLANACMNLKPTPHPERSRYG